ncbi:type III secretion system cytoplasmic ring protein SctQ [Paraburkholderia madseniana]|nr:type III secretion system cytoplasmic ring protein SctQ [Paraburkholderia madseniana]
MSARDDMAGIADVEVIGATDFEQAGAPGGESPGEPVTPDLAGLLDQVDWRVAQHTNRLLGRFAPRACAIGMAEVDFRWDIGAPTGWRPAVTLRARLGNTRFQVHLESVKLVFGDALPPLDTLPDIALRVLAAQACEQAVEAIERMSGETLLIEAVDVLPSQGAGAEGFAFTLEDPVSGRRMRGCVSGHAIELAAQMCAYWPRAEPALERLPVRCRFVIGHARLTCAELKGTSEGDLLLIKRAVESADGLGVAVAMAGSSRIRMRAQANGDGVQIMDDAGFEDEFADPIGLSPLTDAGPEHALHARGEAGEAVAANGSPHPDANPFGELELGLSFELGEQTLTLGELGAIGPGYVFRLAQPVADTQIGIRVNGRVVGNGQLVSLGDVLGVRVTRLLQA